MRISVIAGDPDRVMNPVDYRVTLDGVEQRDCLVVDADKGMILRYKRNKMGLLSMTHDGKKDTEELHGTVVIYHKSYPTEPLL